MAADLPPPPFAVRTAGTIDRRPWHTTPGTRDGDVMLTVVIDGRGLYHDTRGRVRPVPAGSVGLVGPRAPGILSADPEDPYLHHYCRFSGGYARALARAAQRLRGGPFFAYARHRSLGERIARMGFRARRDLPQQMGPVECLLAEILTELAGAPGHEAEPFTHHGLDAWLRQHIDLPTDLSALARQFDVSVSTLTRRARAWLGTTVQAHHEALKLDRAQTLLRESRASIGAIARRVGYEDPAYFARVFRRRHGCPPRIWRQRHS
ncbi:MAG: helix-turn-helix domain-containing protein [Planctomycetota bacterium]